MDTPPPDNLEKVVDRLEEAAHKHDEVTVDMLMDEIGRRSFGPLLLTGGIMMLVPGFSDIPGVPVIMGLFVLLISAQLLFRHDDHFWLPQWMLRREVSGEKLMKACKKWLRKPAQSVDRVLRKRLEKFTGKAGANAIAVIVSLLAISTVAAEFVPFSANIIGLAITLFGLALIAHDGLFALIGWVTVAIAIGLPAYHLIGG